MPDFWPLIDARALLHHSSTHREHHMRMRDWLDGRDPGTMVAAALVIAIVAMAAGYVPAWRASRVEPMRALRSE